MTAEYTLVVDHHDRAISRPDADEGGGSNAYGAMTITNSTIAYNSSVMTTEESKLSWGAGDRTPVCNNSIIALNGRSDQTRSTRLMDLCPKPVLTISSGSAAMAA